MPLIIQDPGGFTGFHDLLQNLDWASSGHTGFLPSDMGGFGIDTSASTGTPVVNSGTWSILNQLSSSFGGTGLDTSASTGVPSISSGTWSVNATLSPTLGGTGLDSSASSGVFSVSAGTWSVTSQLSAGLGGTGIDTSGSTGALSISAGTWSVTAALSSGLGGTGLNTSAATGVPSVSSGIWSVTSQLANSLGGTGGDSSSESGVAQLNSGTWSYSDTIQARSPSQISLIVKGAATQSVNIFEVEDSNANDLFAVNPEGKIASAGTLNNNSGDEYAQHLAYTTNKTGSGDDYGLFIDKTDSNSVGTSYLIYGATGGANKFYIDDEGNAYFDGTVTASGGSYAFKDETYLVLNASADLDNERVLTAGTGMSFTDGGAGGNLTINLADTLVTPGSYTIASLTVDQQGRVTAISSGTDLSGESYVVIGASGNLSAERVLTAGTNISLTDGGANGNATIAFDGTLPIASGGLNATDTPTANYTLRGDGSGWKANLKLTSDSDGKITSSGTLDNATGDEYAYLFEYTTNKATSGADYGLRINKTDTNSPGASYFMAGFYDGAIKFYILDSGSFYSTGGTVDSVLLTPIIRQISNGATLRFQDNRTFSVADNNIEMCGGAISNSSGTHNSIYIKPVYNQSGTAAAYDLVVDRTETALGSGSQRLGSFQVGSSEVFGIDNEGKLIQTATLDDATGNEDVFRINYTVNKATSGDDYGLHIRKTDSNSPGTSFTIAAYTGGALKFYVRDDGLIYSALRILVPTLYNNTSTLALASINNFTAADNIIEMASGTHSNSSGALNCLVIDPTYNQSGTASSADILIDRTETALGSGDHEFLACRVSGADKFTIDNSGNAVSQGEFQGNTLTSLTATTLTIQDSAFSSADNAIEAITGTMTNSSGELGCFAIKPTYNQSGTASSVDILVDRTETATGSGNHEFLALRVGGTDKFVINNTGQPTMAVGLPYVLGTGTITQTTIGNYSMGFTVPTGYKCYICYMLLYDASASLNQSPHPQISWGFHTGGTDYDDVATTREYDRPTSSDLYVHVPANGFTYTPSGTQAEPGTAGQTFYARVQIAAGGSAATVKCAVIGYYLPA